MVPAFPRCRQNSFHSFYKQQTASMSSAQDIRDAFHRYERKILTLIPEEKKEEAEFLGEELLAEIARQRPKEYMSEEEVLEYLQLLLTRKNYVDAATCGLLPIQEVDFISVDNCIAYFERCVKHETSYSLGNYHLRGRTLNHLHSLVRTKKALGFLIKERGMSVSISQAYFLIDFYHLCEVYKDFLKLNVQISFFKKNIQKIRNIVRKGLLPGQE